MRSNFMQHMNNDTSCTMDVKESQFYQSTHQTKIYMLRQNIHKSLRDHYINQYKQTVRKQILLEQQRKNQLLYISKNVENCNQQFLFYAAEKIIQYFMIEYQFIYNEGLIEILIIKVSQMLGNNMHTAKKIITKLLSNCISIYMIFNDFIQLLRHSEQIVWILLTDSSINDINHFSQLCDILIELRSLGIITTSNRIEQITNLCNNFNFNSNTNEDIENIDHIRKCYQQKLSIQNKEKFLQLINKLLENQEIQSSNQLTQFLHIQLYSCTNISLIVQILTKFDMIPNNLLDKLKQVILSLFPPYYSCNKILIAESQVHDRIKNQLTDEDIKAIIIILYKQLMLTYEQCEQMVGYQWEELWTNIEGQ